MNTPRTDAKAYELHAGSGTVETDLTEMTEFARQLERELAEYHAAILKIGMRVDRIIEIIHENNT